MTLGQSLTRLDARAKVTGDALFPGDVNIPGQLWMKVLFARRPHARIKRLDISKAQAAPGVVYVFTARDVPVNEFGLGAKDAPVLNNDEIRWVGEKVALVVAETEKQAEHARDLIEVEYEDLPPITDPREAMKPGAYQVHPHYPGNIIKHIPIRKGDVEQGFAQCDVIVESEYHTPYQEHAYLQPEAGVAYIDEQGRVTVIVGGQWTHEDQSQIAHALALPLDQVRVIYPNVGGAFGGREDMSVQIILALAAYKLRRPVKIIWSREESIIGHHKRHPMWIKHKLGATRDGKLVAAQIQIISDAGPYVYTSAKVLGNAAFGAAGPYEIPNVRVDAYTVATHNIVTGAFRGFGAPQAHFAAETQINKLAEKLGMDPVELRLKNVLREGSLLSTQTPLPGGTVSLPQVVSECAEKFGWSKRSAVSGQQSAVSGRRSAVGVGFACALKNIGFSFGYQENAWAKVELHGGAEIEQVIVYHAAAEVGQGAHTVLAQIAANALNVPIEKIEMRVADTAMTESSGSVSASRMTYIGGNAVKGACELALKKWHDEERPAIAEYKYLAPKTTNFDPETGKSKPNIAYGYVAQAVEVEVDTETGFVRVVRVTCADDVGKAVNPRMIEGQIEGAVVQAQGWTIQENFITKDGYVLTPNLSTYLIPGVLDVPERVDSVILEYPDSDGPWGVRGMAEMPFIPLAAAIIAAVHDATGVWFDEFPLTPWRVLEKIKRAKDAK
ncbi:MAG: xanthine dehydrogenase family protein molybdopterin-binding subunit [Anaerolineae bacterium]|nr:xanthine dehydrogenase family protein molybdopterin-binding subunit [Anaerolineae bacterium]